jgi:hypothetical protein
VAQPVPASVVILSEGGGGIQSPTNDKQPQTPQTRGPDNVTVQVRCASTEQSLIWSGQLTFSWNFLVSPDKHGDGALIYARAAFFHVCSSTLFAVTWSRDVQCELLAHVNVVASAHLLLTLNLLTTTIVALPSNASKWQMGFNSAFKGLRRN